MAGNRLALNLGPLHTAGGQRLVLNLGVHWDDEVVVPPEPPLRGVWRGAAMPWRRGATRARSTVLAWGTSPRLDAGERMAWQPAAPRAASARLPWGALDRRQGGTAMAWAPAERRAATVSAPWRGLPRIGGAVGGGWRTPARVGHSGASGWGGGAPRTRSLSGGWYSALQRRHAHLHSGWQAGQRRDAFARMPWGPTRQAPWVVLPPAPPPEPPQPPTPFPRGTHVGLNLGCPTVDRPGIAPLNLGVTACYGVRLARRVYIVVNTMQVVRLPDRLPIEVEAVGIAGGVGAMGWDLSMSLARPADGALLQPNADGPRQVEVTLNGYVWTFLCEAQARQRAWQEAEGLVVTVTVTGRSPSALLAAPYAPLRSKVSTEARRAQQLVDAELEFTGFTAQYDTLDWVVPAGAWFYDGLPALDAIGRVAAASGAVVLSHPSDNAIRVVPRYPVSPWDWTTTPAAVTVPDDVVFSAGQSVRSQPLYDAVVVAGELEGKGVLVRVVRDGEAGTLYAPQASDPLINTVRVAAERGRNILSDRGSQEAIDLQFPLFPAGYVGGPGRVLPLDLVEVQEPVSWLGLATSVRVDARLDGGALVIDQTVSLERHYSDAN